MLNIDLFSPLNKFYAGRLVCLCLKEGWWVVFKEEGENAYQKDGLYTESPLHPLAGLPLPYTSTEDLIHGGMTSFGEANKIMMSRSGLVPLV